jgi:DNA invertase Pin-like site-specific DNA recombinase
LIFKEKKSSVKERGELKRLLDYVREGDTVVIWKLDRLARSLKDLISIVEMMKCKKVGLVSLTDHIDTTSSYGQLFLHIIGAFAEFERDLIVERTKNGMAAAVAKGKVLGRPKGLSDTARSTARAAATLYQAGMKMRNICETLNISTGTLYRYLRAENVALCGNPGRPRKA